MFFPGFQPLVERGWAKVRLLPMTTNSRGLIAAGVLLVDTITSFRH
jgi:hypothetical protein